jgi:hypothetical protein
MFLLDSTTDIFWQASDCMKSYVNSFGEVDPDAMAIAAEMYYERATLGIRGVMHGTPFIAKKTAKKKTSIIIPVEVLCFY